MKSYEVVGFTYDADTHCTACTREYVEANWEKDKDHDDAVEYRPNIDGVIDGDIEFLDSEGNPIHPIFVDTEAGDTPTHCAECGEFIDDTWTAETVDYAIDSLQDYIVYETGNIETLDAWRDNLGWCLTDDKSEVIMNLYDRVREARKNAEAQERHT